MSAKFKENCMDQELNKPMFVPVDNKTLASSFTASLKDSSRTMGWNILSSGILILNCIEMSPRVRKPEGYFYVNRCYANKCNR